MDHVGSFLDGANLLGPFFVERDFELLFQRHHDFDSVQRIGAQVDKLGVRGDGVEVGAELLGDDASDLVESVGRLFVCEKKKNTGRAFIKVSLRLFLGRLLAFVNSIQNQEKKNKRERREKKRTAAALTEKPARALVATLEVLKLTCCVSMVRVQKRDEESQNASITDTKKKRDPREKDNTREKKKRW